MAKGQSTKIEGQTYFKNSMANCNYWSSLCLRFQSAWTTFKDTSSC